MHNNKETKNRDSSDSSKIAIVGVSFRFPGDFCEESNFWEALKEGKDLVGQIPSDRWAVDELQHDVRSEPGRSITFSAGVLSRIDEFDAGFFGISPREASWMDPQQRLLLEMSWEAMENAQIQPSSLANTDCAVYIGISNLDYGTRGVDDLASFSSHTMTGNTFSIAANRLSYVFDLHGPSLAIDTACSSSLVALDHACKALNTGEASTALVGGVNLLLHPYPFVGFTKASMLSADGRCKSFDASGNGYVRSEGSAVLLLKPLEKAMADGDEIHAVILATGTNSDGSRKTGITIPSGEGQAELMKSVLSRTGLLAKDIDFVEAHGTGTTIGDPIEAAAIGEVYGKERETPLPICSIKANLGHMEPASGMAGIVKTILSLKNRALPPQIHINKLNPHIDFAGLNIEPVRKYMKLQKDENEPLIAGVNSFGFGGTNAHILLQEYQKKEQDVQIQEPECKVLPPLFLSARSDAALRALSGSYSDLLKAKLQQDYYDIAFNTAYKRSRMEIRLALLAQTSIEAEQKLANYSENDITEGIVFEEALPQDGGLAYIYSGNGSQWIGMGQRLLGESEQFIKIMTDLDSKMQVVAGFSILLELQLDGELSRLDDTVIAQPLLFAIQVATTLMLKEHGIEPMAVTGHSVGEVAAAWAAGALDLESAIRVIVARSREQGKTKGSGRMAAVGLSATAMQELLDTLGDSLNLSIAGINSPNNITLSGSMEDLIHMQKYFEDKGIFFRILDLDYAFHSEQMDPIREPLIESLVGLEPLTTKSIDFVSTVTGDIMDKKQLDADYWWHNVREPVRFSDAVTKLAELGCRVFVEIGPHAILQRYINECLEASEVKGRVLGVLHKNSDGLERVTETALRIHMLVEKPNYDNYFPKDGRYLKLPNYPWQRERYWQPKTSEALLSVERRRVHPLLGWKIPEVELVWENIIDPIIIPWLSDHKVGDAIVFPGAAYTEMALAAAHEWQNVERLALEELDIVSPMVFDGEHARTLQFELNSRDGSFQIKSRERLSFDEWTLHAVGRILEAGSRWATPGINPVISETDVISHETHYSLATDLGLEYGPAFMGLKEAVLSGNLLEAKLEFSDDLSLEKYFIHPGVLDICYQSLIDFYHIEIKAGRGVALLPIKNGYLELYKHARAVKFRARINRRSARSVQADFELFDAEENLIASIYGCRFRAAPLGHKKQEEVDSWHIIPWLQPHPSGTMVTELPSSNELVDYAKEKILNIEEERRSWFQEALPLFEALTLSFAYEAFQEIEQAKRLDNIVMSTDKYTSWLVEILKGEELIGEQDGHWLLSNDSDLPAAEEIWRALLHEHPHCLPQLTLLGQIGRHLPKLLQEGSNRKDFFDTLLDSSALEVMYNDDSAYFGTRFNVENMLQQISEEFPKNNRLRILEITAGASEVPHALLSLLPEDRLDYVLAVENEALLGRQEAEYTEFPNLTVTTFDTASWEIESDKTIPEYFDVVILRHSLHMSANLKTALSQTRKWLAIGGQLIIAERYPDWSADFIAGLDSTWWQNTTENNLHLSSLLAPSEWERILKDEEFDDVLSFAEPAADGLAAGSYMVLAKRSQNENKVLPVSESSSWLLLVDNSSMELADSLREKFEPFVERIEVAEKLTIENLEDFHNIVYLLGWETLPETLSDLPINLLEDVQTITSKADISPKLWLITKGGALASKLPSEYLANPAQASLWGFGRVMMNEYPALNCTLIDIANDFNLENTILRLENELLRPDGKSEVLLYKDTRYTLVMCEDEKTDTVLTDKSERFRLDFHLPGKLRNLVWMPQEENSLQRDDIEVQVQATGLNFRDVMYLMGLLPDEAVENGFAGSSLGLEFSGIVSKVGMNVHDLQVGDRVMGFGSSCFSSHVITRADAVAIMPKEWSFEAATTVPTVFFTVYYALHHLADLQENESVLIHGGAGGVGIAAIQLAKHLGAKVFATAGSEEKRSFVNLLGVEHVFDSRSFSFAEDIMAATNGEGVDVILNSLAGEAIRRNLSILKPFGRFLELGKRDFFENTPIGLRPFRNNISYFGIDADQLLTGRPKLAARMFREVMALFHEGILMPLPYRVFNAEQVVDAFRFMQQSRHIGKVVVSMVNSHPVLESSLELPKQKCFTNESTWLVTGGLSGFGLESARWLAERGVGNLALVSRNGLNTVGAKEAIEELTAKGINVHEFSCDVTDADAVALMIEQVKQTMPPLKGVLHAAAIYEDAFIQNLDAIKMRKVIAPKFLGAWNLHKATLEISLDYFILYSSVTTAIGNPGQANYVAANAALEGLARMRRSIGLPATCIAWGPIGDAGYLTRNTEVMENLTQRLGKTPISASEALKKMGYKLSKDVVIANFEWATLSHALPSSQSSRFAILNRALKDTIISDDEIDFKTLIAGKNPEEVFDLVVEFVTQEVAQILAIDVSRIGSLKPLHDLGLDSLMAVELALSLEQRIGVQLPVMMLNDSPTVEKVTKIIMKKLLGDPEITVGDDSNDMIQALAKQHGETLDDDDLKNIVDKAVTTIDKERM